jgi:hypothetical protein
MRCEEGGNTTEEKGRKVLRDKSKSMRRNYGAPTQQADLTECTIKNLLEKFPRRKRIGRNSQNCTEK